ncbi:hypothetical protein SAMN04488540_109142 [Ferrimonas sediminum]|uniref:Methyltransferase n=1 Tax=Ferrimonas sediminum TaxID=718193 RepID=A0A1G8UMR1_9GAMM|nr:hypothetical protein SAMN04488540_109142 [Ferrimonas sediminum]
MKPMLLAAAVALMPLVTQAHSDTAPHTADLSHWAQGPHRSEANVARNQYRHPVQTLEFLGLHPDMTVIELWPGGGWYTEILAPFLRDNGTFIAASFETEPKLDTPRSRYRAGVGKRYEQKLAATPSLYGKVQVVTFDPPRTTRLGVEASAHMVLTFRNLHNWAVAGDLLAVFEAVFEVLTPGGYSGWWSTGASRECRLSLATWISSR